jgi:peptidoglycan/LPS O-acetylase OafA/YrhL
MPQLITADIGDKHKLHGLDHLRALAIILVFFFHYQFFGHPGWEQGRLSNFGWTGVDLFFVLSGFLIAGQLFNTVAKGKTISVKEFIVKRFFRIIPPYLLVVIIYFVFPGAHEWGQLSALWRYLTFTLNFGLDLRKYGTFSHAWSLCVEEQFYLILPLIFWLFSFFKPGRKPFYLVGALFICGFIVRLLCWHYFAAPYLNTSDFNARFNEYVYYPTYNRLDGLLTGVSIAGLFTFYPNFKEWVNKRSYLVLSLGVLMLVAAFLLCPQQSTYNTAVIGFTLISLAFGLIVAAFVSPSNIFYKLKSKVTAQIAALSYSIYLSHKIIIHLMQSLLEKAGMDKNNNLTMLICIICVMAGALTMRYLIEKPALRLRNIVLSKMRTSAGHKVEFQKSI